MRLLPLMIVGLGALFCTAVRAEQAPPTSEQLKQIFQDLAALSAKGVTGTKDTADDREFRKLLKKASDMSGARPAKKERVAAAPPPTDIQRGQDDYRREHGIPAPPPVTKKAPDSFCDPATNLYIRSDRLDTYLYGVQSLDQAKGASVSFTDDHLTKHQTTNISGVASYVVLRQVCLDPPKNVLATDGYLSGYAIAPWVYGNGTLNNFSPKTEQSALKFGLDVQYAWIGGPIFDAQSVVVSPYYQTDFRQEASAYGLTASWQPLWADAHLGGALGRGNAYLYWFWQFALEADIRRVDVPGLTQLKVGDSAWFGSTTRVHLFLLPSVFNRRLHVDGTLQAYWDASSSRSITKYVGSVAYNLTDDGNASISLEYDRGTDKDTLAKLDQYLVKLNAKY